MIEEEKRSAQFQALVTAVPDASPPPRPETAAMTLQDAVRMVRENSGNIHFVREIVEALGGYDVVRKAKPKPVPVPLPLDQVWAVEISLGHIVRTSGPKRTSEKPPRPDQAAAKHKAVVQAWFKGDTTDFANPDWHGEALLFEPKRAIANLKKQKRCSDAYKQWVENIVAPQAIAQGCMLGVLYISDKVDYPGMNFYDQHVVLVPKEAIDNPTNAKAFLIKPEGLAFISGFKSKTATGKNFGGTFFRQARGLLNDRAMSGWNAGLLEYHAM